MYLCVCVCVVFQKSSATNTCDDPVIHHLSIDVHLTVARETRL